MCEYVELLAGHAIRFVQARLFPVCRVPSILPSFGIPAGPHWSYLQHFVHSLQSCYVMSTQLPVSGPANLAGPGQAAGLVPISGTHTFRLLSSSAESVVEHSFVLLPTRSVAHATAEIVVIQQPESRIS